MSGVSIGNRQGTDPATVEMTITPVANDVGTHQYNSFVATDNKDNQRGNRFSITVRQVSTTQARTTKGKALTDADLLKHVQTDTKNLYKN